MSARIVIVDDDQDIRELVAFMLTDLGGFIVVGQAASVAEGRRVLERTRPDLAILDIGLPDGSGAELIGYPSEDPARSVVLSAQVTGYHAEMRSIGADAVLDKPCAPQVLIKAVAEVLKS